MACTFEEVRARFPKLTDEQIRDVVRRLNTPPLSVKEIWANEDVFDGPPPVMDADGLTEPMRRLNRFAEERALPLPFPPKKRDAAL